MFQQSVESKDDYEIVHMPDVARQTLETYSSTHRKSISYLIKASHNLNIPYIDTLRLSRKEVQWNKENKCFSIIITDKDKCVAKIVENVDNKLVRPLFLFWQTPRKVEIIPSIKFIRVCLDVLGIAIGQESKLPIGFYANSTALKDASIN